MELNREQIIKALECCIADKSSCDKCPIQTECESNPFDAVLARYALALIKELTNENERLRAELKQRPPKLIITKLLKKEKVYQIAKELLEEIDEE